MALFSPFPIKGGENGTRNRGKGVASTVLALFRYLSISVAEAWIGMSYVRSHCCCRCWKWRYPDVTANTLISGLT